jgi:hypothetical protein
MTAAPRAMQGLYKCQTIPHEATLTMGNRKRRLPTH